MTFSTKTPKLLTSTSLDRSNTSEVKLNFSKRRNKSSSFMANGPTSRLPHSPVIFARFHHVFSVIMRMLLKKQMTVDCNSLQPMRERCNDASSAGHGFHSLHQRATQ